MDEDNDEYGKDDLNGDDDGNGDDKEEHAFVTTRHRNTYGRSKQGGN